MQRVFTPHDFPSLPGSHAVTWTQRRDTRGVLNLKSCELQFDAASDLLGQALATLEPSDLWRYPYQAELLEALRTLWDIPDAGVMVSAGSGSVIGAVVDALAVPAGRLILHEPMFEYWGHFATLRGLATERCAGVIERHIPEISTELFAQALQKGPQAVAAITNPVNPLGSLIPLNEMRTLGCLAADSGHILVIDDCYGDFAASDQLSLVNEHPNVIVIRSLSKSWGLAGARLGVCVGSPELIKRLESLQLDAAISAVAIRMATYLAARPADLKWIWSMVGQTREWFIKEVLRIFPTWVALPSVTNFVTFRTPYPGGGDAVASFLAKYNVRVRSYDLVDGLRGCVRISVAEQEKMNYVLEILQGYS